jgi:hypothetical protein
LSLRAVHARPGAYGNNARVREFETLRNVRGLLLIFILYLIDKHNQWRRAAKVELGILALALLVAAAIYAWNRHTERLAQEDAREGEELYNKQKASEEQLSAEMKTPSDNKHVVVGPDGKHYAFSKDVSPKRIDAYFAKKFPHVKVLRDADLTTEEFGSLKSGHLEKDEIATLLVDDGGWVKVKTPTGGVGWSRSDSFGVLIAGQK